MCGRFTLLIEVDSLQQEFDLSAVTPDLAPRYNIAPSQPVAVIRDSVERKLELFRWGLIPSWAKDPAIGYRLINARAETLGQKPAFRKAFAQQRCLILADGFYEWEHPKTGKARGIPYYFRLASRKPFGFAGLWESWRSPEGETVYTATIITCPANARVVPFHERMPVILDRSTMWDWLKKDAPARDLSTLLVPYPAEQMEAYQVSTAVNSPANDSAVCIQPVT